MNVYLSVLDPNNDFERDLNMILNRNIDIKEYFIDFRGKNMNWYFYDFVDWYHPIGIRGNPNLIRRGSFNYTIDVDQLSLLIDELWEELYNDIKEKDFNIPSDIFSLYKYICGNNKYNFEKPYIELTIFLTLVVITRHGIEWKFY